MSTWDDAPQPEARTLRALDYARIVWRGAPLVAMLGVCFPLLLILRVPERAIWGLRRPVTPYITQFVCIWACRFMALDRHVIGTPMQQPGAYVSNHVSWLDILAGRDRFRIEPFGLWGVGSGFIG